MNQSQWYYYWFLENQKQKIYILNPKLILEYLGFYLMSLKKVKFLRPIVVSMYYLHPTNIKKRRFQLNYIKFTCKFLTFL